MALSMLAGYVDAIAFLRLNGLFISFMSGNSTQLGVGLGVGQLSTALESAAVIGTFVIGVIAGALMGRAGGVGRPGILACETLLLLAAGLLQAVGQVIPAIGAMTLAMGVENGVFQGEGAPSVSLTYMTGTLVKTGRAIAVALTGGAPFGWVQHFVLWAGFAGGAAAGAFCYRQFGMQTVWGAVVWAAALTAIVTWRSSRQATGLSS